jgi:CRISPR-associated protein Cmx8
VSKADEPQSLTLKYDLNDLPTSQHRAGLAGLLLQIRSMKARRVNPREIPDVSEPTVTTVDVTFTAETIQGVFDDLYAAMFVEAASPNRWAKATIKREDVVDRVDKKTKKTKSVKMFIYDVVEPKLLCLEGHRPGPDDPWVKLARMMIWSIPRGIHTTRAPYKSRAEGKSCAEGRLTWQMLLADRIARVKGRFKTESISGALMLGGQSVNAEAVPFEGRVDQNLLLHFWQAVVIPYVPRFVDKKERKTVTLGYVLPIPDVADLREFCLLFPEVIAGLDPRAAGYRRPAGAMIDLPAQANLELLKGLEETRLHSQTIATDQSLERGWDGSVRAIDSFHMDKAGNNVKMLSFSRVIVRPGLIGEYTRINRTYRNPLFRAALMRALLGETPWHAGIIDLFNDYPAPFFIEGEKTPKFIPRFGRDARAKFQALFQDTRDMKPDDMTDDERLALIVHRLVSRYVDGRAEAKSGLKVDTFKKRIDDRTGRSYTDYPKAFREKQESVCSQAFLEMRSRHDQVFVDYFAGSICSVAQRLNQDDYRFLTRILLTRSDPNPTGRKTLNWEDVKALAMIAVSARSYVVHPRDPQPEGANS